MRIKNETPRIELAVACSGSVVSLGLFKQSCSRCALPTCCQPCETQTSAPTGNRARDAQYRLGKFQPFAAPRPGRLKPVI